VWRGAEYFVVVAGHELPALETVRGVADDFVVVAARAHAADGAPAG
jgi:hypothetical protein